jgi:hypothetical protein
VSIDLPFLRAVLAIAAVISQNETFVAVKIVRTTVVAKALAL